MAATVAMTRLLAGPAAAIIMNFCRQLSRSFRMSTGTGFAQPMIGRFVVMAISGKTIVPIRSMCTAGFSDTRPRNRAVGSPSRSAVQAWAASCTVREKTQDEEEGEDLGEVDVRQGRIRLYETHPRMSPGDVSGLRSTTMDARDSGWIIPIAAAR